MEQRQGRLLPQSVLSSSFLTLGFLCYRLAARLVASSRAAKCLSLVRSPQLLQRA